MLEQLTIIIITYQRYPFLKRLLKFYESYHSEARFLILDSSPDLPEDTELKELLGQDQVTWKRFDSSTFFVHKISEGCKHVETEYAVLCADDDFLIPTGLTSSVAFLSENSDYASAHGLYFNHTNNENSHKNGFEIIPIYQNGRSSKEEFAKVRLNAYLSGETGYYPLYAVHRTELFQLIWTETNNFISDWGLSEKFPCALSFIYGKMKVLPVFYASREPNTYSWYDENRIMEMYNEEKVQLASEGLGKHLCEVDNMEPEQSHSVALHVRNTFLESRNKKKANRHNWYVSTCSWIRKNIGFRRYLRKIFLNGSHPSIYPKYRGDHFKLKQAVMSNNIPAEELNKSRRQYAQQGFVVKI